jgi:hypothetical protein
MDIWKVREALIHHAKKLPEGHYAVCCVRDKKTGRSRFLVVLKPEGDVAKNHELPFEGLGPNDGESGPCNRIAGF